MTEFELMKNNPTQLFNEYLDLLSQGIELNDDQIPKFEYLKKLLIKE
jgi:hypothetical protein